MKKCIAEIKGVSPLTQSKVITTPKEARETHDAHEQRTWKERCHIDEEGMVYIRGIAFKLAMSEAAKFLSISIPGQGKATYTKNFEAGVMVMDNLPLNIHIDDVKGLTIHVPSDGKRGGSKRVWKTFPIFHKWGGLIEFTILDDIINKEVFEKVLNGAGSYIGIGSWRPRNNGMNGRFKADILEWEEI